MAVGLEKITSKILADAKQESKGIVGEAEKEAKGIISEAESSARLQAEKIAAQYKEMAAGIKERVEASARLNAKMRHLGAENRAIESAFEKAEANLAKFRKSANYAKFLEAEILSSLNEEGKGSAEIVLSSEDRKLLNSSLLQRIRKKAGREVSLSKESREISGGVIVIIPERGIEINRSFEAKLALCREKMLVDIAKSVYPKEENNG